MDASVRAEGAVVFWQSADATDRQLLIDGMTPLGWKDFVPERRPMTQILFDALKHSLGCPTTLIRPLKVPGFCVVLEQRGDKDLPPVHTPAFSCIIEGDKINVHPHSEAGTQLFLANRDLIKAQRERAERVVRPSQVTTMLIKLLDHLRGIRLRPSGSVYWLPTDRLTDWQSITGIVEGANLEGRSAVYTVRTILDSDTIRAAHDALTTQVSKLAKDIEEDLDSGLLGARALGTRIKAAQEMRERVVQYEVLLSENLSGLRTVVDAIESASLAAQLTEIGKKQLQQEG